MHSALQYFYFFFFFQAEDGIRDLTVTGVQTCALPISSLSSTTRNPKSPSRVRSRSKVQNAGSPSKRGKQAQTISPDGFTSAPIVRSEEHTSELQSQSNLVCRLLLEKKKKKDIPQAAQISLTIRH